MKNWNTDATKFKNATAKRIWELIQMVEYGFDGEKVPSEELKEHWSSIKMQVNPQKRRLFEFYLWGKQYSLPINTNSWIQSPKIVK